MSTAISKRFYREFTLQKGFDRKWPSACVDSSACLWKAVRLTQSQAGRTVGSRLL